MPEEFSSLTVVYLQGRKGVETKPDWATWVCNVVNRLVPLRADCFKISAQHSFRGGCGPGGENTGAPCSPEQFSSSLRRDPQKAVEGPITAPSGNPSTTIISPKCFFLPYGVLSLRGVLGNRIFTIWVHLKSRLSLSSSSSEKGRPGLPGGYVEIAR